MRFGSRLTFVKLEGGGYDPGKGEYVDPEEVRETLPCHLSPMSTDRTNEVFGSIQTNITIARLQNQYSGDYDRVEIDEKPFSVQRRIDHRGRSVFYLEGA